MFAGGVGSPYICLVEAVGTVTSLARLPVKSLLGERPDRVTVDTRGVRSDRLWAVTTPDGKLGSGKSSRIVEQTLRCVMVTSAQHDSDRDPGLLSAISEANEMNLGVLAEVVRPGVLRCGDTPRIL